MFENIRLILVHSFHAFIFKNTRTFGFTIKFMTVMSFMFQNNYIH